MACLNCKTLIELMQKEIEELKDKEQQLEHINATLQKVASEVHLQTSSSWKSKYQQ